jgi:predicted Zn-dependent protease
MMKGFPAILLLTASLFSLASCSLTGQHQVRSETSEEAYLFYYRAVEAEMESDWEEALKHLNLALREDPESVYLLTETGRVLLKLNRVKEATDTVEKAIRKDPSSIPALSLLGKVYSNQRKYERAAEIYERILELEPEKTKTYILLAHLYNLDRRYEKAITILEKAMGKDPEHGERPGECNDKILPWKGLL